MLAVSAAKLIVLPLIAFVLSWFVFGLRGTDLCVNVILTAMPTSVSSYIMACEMETDPELMASIIGFTTFVSVVTISSYRASGGCQLASGGTFRTTGNLRRASIGTDSKLV